MHAGRSQTGQGGKGGGACFHHLGKMVTIRTTRTVAASDGVKLTEPPHSIEFSCRRIKQGQNEVWTLRLNKSSQILPCRQSHQCISDSNGHLKSYLLNCRNGILEEFSVYMGILPKKYSAMELQLKKN